MAGDGREQKGPVQMGARVVGRALIVVLLIILPFMKSYAEPPARPGEVSELDLSNLGFSPEDTKAAPELARVLEDRRFYLRQHQVWGLVSAGTMALAVLSGGEGELPPEHAFLAGLAATSYGAAAYTAWKAPQLPHGKESGGTRWHRRLVWVHLPGMILTPILGYLAAKKIDNGEKLDGIEKYHKDVAGVTAIALAVSALTVSFEF